MECLILLPKDSEKYRNIRLESLLVFPDSFSSTFERESTRGKLFFQKNIEDKSENNFVVGCFEKGNLIGICSFYILPETTDIGELVQLYVKKEYQRQGIARQLIRKVIEKAFLLDKVKNIQLGVLTENISVIKLYEDLGFKEYDFQKDVIMKNNKYLDLVLMEFKK
jgi:ribosomal protein S18 acetylase RimI-like enzyme|tara:strand:+ start:93 stop:590 length:498 start_codon:yes stop_codon:yes gene_type:complete